MPKTAYYTYIIIVDDIIVEGENSKLAINKSYDQYYKKYKEDKRPSLEPAIYKLEKA